MDDTRRSDFVRYLQSGRYRTAFYLLLSLRVEAYHPWVIVLKKVILDQLVMEPQLEELTADEALSEFVQNAEFPSAFRNGVDYTSLAKSQILKRVADELLAEYEFSPEDKRELSQIMTPYWDMLNH